ncbi:MAG TPA: S8 family serine peptidase [Kofleriaceae bacterium]|nr:S8 family serine peptidase [Kofleriaceae bacterium]
MTNSLTTKTLFALALGTLAFGCATPAAGDDQNQSTADDGAGQDPSVKTIQVCSGGQWQCKAHVVVDEHNRIAPHATPAGLGPADLQSAYKLTAAPSPTVTIAIVDAFNYPNVESDLAQYRSAFGLPPCTKANGCLKVVNQDGATSPLPGNSPAGDDWTVAAALDLDMASAICPSCHLLFVEAQDDQGNGLFIGQNAAAAAGAVVVSDSWGGPSGGLASDQSFDSQFFTHTSNICTFVATGDAGFNTSPDYPSTSHLVVGVGGTHLVKSTAARGWTETTWSGAGSSCGNETKPAFQTAAVPSTTCARRAASDVSAVADPNTGLAVFNAGAGGFIVVGGTSAASPIVAAIYARLGLSCPNHDASYVYAHPCELFDITSGSNGTCTGSLCHTGVGWDGPTGLGTPNGAVFGKNTTCTGGTGNPPACSHPLCSTGAALPSSGGCTSGGNTTCEASICSADSFCCTSSWDSVCVGEVKSVCGLTCPGF